MAGITDHPDMTLAVDCGQIVLNLLTNQFLVAHEYSTDFTFLEH